MSLSTPFLENSEKLKRKIILSEALGAFMLPNNPFAVPWIGGLIAFHYARVGLSPIEATYNACTGQGPVVDIIARPVTGALYPAFVAVCVVVSPVAMVVAHATGGKKAVDNLRDKFNEDLNKIENYVYGPMELPKRKIEVPQ